MITEVSTINPEDEVLIARFAAHIESLGRAERTVRQHRETAASFARFMAPKRLAEAVEGDVEGWLRARVTDRTSTEARRVYREQVRRLFEWAIAAGAVAMPSPVARLQVGRPSLRDRYRAALDEASMAVLDEHLRDCARRGLRPDTKRHREGSVLRLGMFIAPTPLLQLTRADVERWIDDQIERGLVANSRRNYLKHVKQFTEWCAKRGHIEQDPAAEVEPPRVPTGTPHPIPEVDLQQALTAATGVLRAWLVLGAYCGLRAGEIAMLRREDVLDRQPERQVRVDDGKGGKGRLVPLPAEVLAELRPYLVGKRGRLWLTGVKDPSDMVTHRVGDFLHGLGIPHSAHALRHYYATELYRRSGGDILMVKEMLGHASVATTQIYASFDQQVASRVTAEMAASLGGQPLPPAPSAAADEPLAALKAAITASGLTPDQQAALQTLVAAFAPQPIGAHR